MKKKIHPDSASSHDWGRHKIMYELGKSNVLQITLRSTSQVADDQINTAYTTLSNCHTGKLLWKLRHPSRESTWLSRTDYISEFRNFVLRKTQLHYLAKNPSSRQGRDTWKVETLLQKTEMIWNFLWMITGLPIQNGTDCSIANTDYHEIIKQLCRN